MALPMRLVLAVCIFAVSSAAYYDSGYGSEPSYDYDYSSGSYGKQERYDQGYDYEEVNEGEPTYGAGHRNYEQDRYDDYDSGSFSRRGGSRYGRRYSNYDMDDDESSSPRRRSYSRGSRMDQYGRSGYSQRTTHYVPVVIKKKKEKKRKIVSVHHGFYIPGGTAIYGKFKDIKSCQKACELSPTCFGADYNPWLSKCFLHSNLTACQSMRAHKKITHFKKIPCSIVETPRGLITLGAAIYNGLEQKGIKNLMDCIKRCATAGGGVAPLPSTAASTPQLCFGIDYDFANHKCYFHTNIAVCGGIADANATPLTPVTMFPSPSTLNILICPIAPEG